MTAEYAALRRASAENPLISRYLLRWAEAREARPRLAKPSVVALRAMPDRQAKRGGQARFV
jgi:hypothetical protein